MLPIGSVRALREHLARVRELHDAEVAEGFGKVWLSQVLARKDPWRGADLAVAMGLPVREVRRRPLLPRTCADGIILVPTPYSVP
jgi:hypothetical protein